MPNRIEKNLRTAPFLRNGEPEFLRNIIVKLPENATILEIGTFRGLSAVYMAQQKKDIKIVTIDSHIGIPGNHSLYSNPYIVNDNFKKYHVADRITHFAVSTQDYGPNQMFDMLFIDGDHSLAGVTFDYCKFERFVKPGGYIVFHDYGDHRGVTEFCDSLTTKKFGFKSMLAIQKE